MKEFKTPILSQIYNAIGWVIVAIGVITAAFTLLGGALMGISRDISGLLGFSGVLMSVLATVIILLVTALIALPFFGIAQVITYFCHTAYHAQSMDEWLNKSLYQMQKT